VVREDSGDNPASYPILINTHPIGFWSPWRLSGGDATLCHPTVLASFGNGGSLHDMHGSPAAALPVSCSITLTHPGMSLFPRFPVVALSLSLLFVSPSLMAAEPSTGTLIQLGLPLLPLYFLMISFREKIRGRKAQDRSGDAN
jgi:hypothetical protein